MVASRHVGLLLLVLMSSGCSTITTEPPKDANHYAEIAAVVNGDTPEVIIEHIAAYSGFGSEDFFTGLDQKEPRKLFLSPGKYSLKVACYPLYHEPVDSSELDITVESGKKYLLGCHNGVDYHHIYLEPQP